MLISFQKKIFLFETLLFLPRPFSLTLGQFVKKFLSSKNKTKNKHVEREGWLRDSGPRKFGLSSKTYLSTFSPSPPYSNEYHTEEVGRFKMTYTEYSKIS